MLCPMGKTSRQTSPKCPVERAAKIVGGRWTALIMRDLLQKGRCRYQDFVHSLPGVPPNTLSDRLKMLEAHGIVERHVYDEHPLRADYVLTEKGRELRPIIKAMRDWGLKHR
jgi:DNA-binding HxlR family transcriptional regulator